MTRLSWTETWAVVARTVGMRSRCVRAQIGAVIVDQSNRPVAVGYNGPPAGFPVEGDCRSFCPRAQNGAELRDGYVDCVSVHAELNALLATDRSRCIGGTIFINGDPCYSCAKAIANSGLVRVVVVDGGQPWRDPDKSIAFLEECGLEVVRG